MAFQVTAPLVQARKKDGTFVHVYEGGFLPDDQDSDQLEQLVAAEMVVEADAPADPDEDPKPSRSRGKAS